MKKGLTISALVLAVLAMTAIFAPAAMAHPTYASACTGCHGSATGLTVKATQVSNNGTTATYNVSVTGGSGSKGWALLQGATSVKSASAATGSFTASVGKSYTLWGVDTGLGGKSITVAPTAPAPPPPAPGPDVTAPTTKSNAKASYAGTSTITLTATDNTGGSGVAHTYYILDGGVQTEGKTITVGALGSHTLQFWSTDVAGNVESTKTATFSITEPLPPVPVTAKSCVVSIRVLYGPKGLKGATVSLYNKATKKTSKAVTNARGYVLFKTAPYGSYTMKITYKNKVRMTKSLTFAHSKFTRAYKIGSPRVDD